MKYSDLVEIYEKLEGTTKRLEKTFYISELLKKTPADDLPQLTLLLQGRLYPAYDERELGVASRLVLKALAVASGSSADEVEKNWKKTGDLGLSAESLIEGKKQHTLTRNDLSVKKVFDNLRKLTEMEGQGTVDRKVKLIAELLTSATKKEAKYIIRTVLQDLRVGVGEGALRDAIVWAFFGDELNIKYDNKEEKDVVDDEHRERYNEYNAKVQHLYDMTADFGKLAQLVKEKGDKAFGKTTLEPGKPIKVMLYQKAEGFEDAFERVGKPAAFEYKIDGFRMQIHRNGSKINLFTRRLDDVTKQFPDVIELIKENVKSENFIIDTEIVGIDPATKQWLPFQNISQRIKRIYDVADIAKKIPIMINVFDAMDINGESLLMVPFSERRKRVKAIIHEKKDKIEMIRQIITDQIGEAKEFYKESLAKGNEGVMAKKLDAEYKPGSRVGFGVKIKPVMETLDLAIVGAEWGEGKRSEWLSSFTLACRHGKDFYEIGKVGTGIKELEQEGVTFEQLTKLIKPNIFKEEGRYVHVKPKIIVEINYEEIQKSPTYSSGYALRFPRVLRLRLDKGIDDVDDINRVEGLYKNQRK